MDTVTMAVERVTVTLIEVPAHLSTTMRIDVALRKTGRGFGLLNMIGSTYGTGIKGQSSTTVKEHKWCGDKPC